MCGNPLSGLWGCEREFWALIKVCGGGLLYNRGLSAAETRMPPSPDDRGLCGGIQQKSITAFVHQHLCVCFHLHDSARQFLIVTPCA